jgi:serine/threonine protein kinase
MKQLRCRQRFGKYVIEGRLGEGAYATVYRARDTIEGIHVALKIPHEENVTKDALALFQREVRLASRLDHPHILALKTADFVEDRFVVVTAMGEGTLESRLQRRLATSKALLYTEQMIDAVACAHAKKIIHCDLKPENFILFPGDHIRLADFGIAIVAQRTVKGSGSGTVGFMAPEQALGRPSMRSDVFSLGLIFYRMFAGALPEWPFQWPPPGHHRLTMRLHPEVVALIQRAMHVDSKQRFASAEQMLTAFRRIPVSKRAGDQKTLIRVNGAHRDSKTSSAGSSWRSVRFRDFQRRFKKTLETNDQCGSCGGPIAESMTTCPWCAKSHRKYPGETRFPEQCPRCARGLKRDWKYCPWCRGAGFDVSTSRQYVDRRYSKRQKCRNSKCKRKLLLPFMRYCPWCNSKVRRPWKIVDLDGLAQDQRPCKRCAWGVLPDFWSCCPWCAASTEGSRK